MGLSAGTYFMPSLKWRFLSFDKLPIVLELKQLGKVNVII